MDRDSMVFYRSFYEAIKELKPSVQAEIYNAIFSYSLDFIEPKFKGITNTIWTLIKPQLDANINKYHNGIKGGRPKIKKNQSITKAKPNNNLNITKQKPKHNQKISKAKANVNVNVNDNDNVNVNEKENIKENISFFSPTKLNINDYDLKFSDKLKDKFIQFLEMNNMSNLHTLTEQIEIVNNYLKKYTEQQIIDSLKYAISLQNKSFNPEWINEQPDSNGFTFLTDKDIHN